MESTLGLNRKVIFPSGLREEESENKHKTGIFVRITWRRELTLLCELESSGWTTCYWASWEGLKKRTQLELHHHQELSPLSTEAMANPGAAQLVLGNSKPCNFIT